MRCITILKLLFTWFCSEKELITKLILNSAANSAALPFRSSEVSGSLKQLWLARSLTRSLETLILAKAIYQKITRYLQVYTNLVLCISSIYRGMQNNYYTCRDSVWKLVIFIQTSQIRSKWHKEAVSKFSHRYSSGVPDGSTNNG